MALAFSFPWSFAIQVESRHGNNQWLFMVPVKGGLGAIYSPNWQVFVTTYIPLIVQTPSWKVKNATDPTFYGNQKQLLKQCTTLLCKSEFSSWIMNNGSQYAYMILKKSSNNNNNNNNKHKQPAWTNLRNKKIYRNQNDGFFHGWLPSPQLFHL